MGIEPEPDEERQVELEEGALDPDELGPEDEPLVLDEGADDE